MGNVNSIKVHWLSWLSIGKAISVKTIYSSFIIWLNIWIIHCKQRDSLSDYPFVIVTSYIIFPAGHMEAGPLYTSRKSDM